MLCNHANLETVYQQNADVCNIFSTNRVHIHANIVTFHLIYEFLIEILMKSFNISISLPWRIFQSAFKQQFDNLGLRAALMG